MADVDNKDSEVRSINRTQDNQMTNVYGWSCVSSEVAWSPRDGAQLVSFQGKLFLLGGWNQYAFLVSKA